MSDKSLIQVQDTSIFQRNIRRFAKKYRNIRNDIQPAIEQLAQG